jgi:exosortase family protein XrtM
MNWHIASLSFGIRFLVIFSLLTSAFEFSRGSSFEKFVVEDLILRPTTMLINAIMPSEHVESKDRSLVAATTRLHVIRGCEGIEMFLLLTAGIFAFPATAKRRAQGLLFGSILSYVLAVTRLMALYYILRLNPAAWEALHGLILPLAPVILIALYFLRWSASGMAIDNMQQDTDAA